MAAGNLLTQRRFWPFFWVNFLTSFNDNLFKGALVVLFASQEWLISSANGVIILPFVLLSATAGQVSDRYSKAATIRTVKLIELPVMVLAAFGLLTLNIPVLLGALFLAGAQTSFFGPAKYSFLPEVLDDDELVGGNGLIELGTFLSVLLGTIAGGILVVLGPAGVSITVGSMIVVALVGIGCAQLVERRPPAAPGLRIDPNPISPNVKIISDTYRNWPVFLAILGLSWFWFFGVSFMTLVPTYVTQSLHGQKTVVTLFMALFSVGVGVGSVLCEQLSRGRLELGLVPFGSVGMSVFALDLFLVGVPELGAQPGWLTLLSTAGGLRICVDLLGVAMFGGFFTVPLYTLIQQRTDATLRSRVVAGNNIINSAFMVASAGYVIGLRALGFDVPTMFLMLGVLNLLVAAYIYSVIPEYLMRFALWVLSGLIYRARLTGQMPRHGAHLLVANHVTTIDWLFIAAASSWPVHFVMHRHPPLNPLLRWLLRGAKVITTGPLEVGSELPAEAAATIEARLKAGELVCLFPEATRSPDGKVGPFVDVITDLATRCDVPVVPVALGGLWGSTFSRVPGKTAATPVRRFRSRVDVTVGEPFADVPDVATLRARIAELGGLELA